jgi:hypothetical protein
MKALILLAFLGQAEPTGTLTLACQGTETQRGGGGTTSEQINIGVIVDFQKRLVIGFSDSPLRITGVDETTISFSGEDTGWGMNGGIDRVTGWLHGASLKSDPSTRKTILSISYDLQCKPTQRMF